MKITVLFLTILLVGCGEAPNNCGIDSGTMVVSKLDGRSGMVIAAWEYVPQVEVRFPAGQVTTDTHTLSADGPVQFSPYADVVMRCFEIDVKR